jgi:hypothetical protein
MGRHAGIVVMAVLLGLTAGGCANDAAPSGASSTGDTTPAIVGKWTLVKGGGVRKHLVFKTDNSFVFLDEHPYGIRTIETGIYQAVSGTIDLGNDQYPSLYAFSITNDTLVMSTPNLSLTGYRNASAPADTQWARTVTTLYSFPAPIATATDIACKDSSLWYGNAYSAHHLFKINLSTGVVDTSLVVSAYAWAVEWADTSLWCGSNGYDAIMRISPVTGISLFQSKPMGAWIYGIAWDGARLWCSSNNEQSLYRYNPTTDVVEQTYTLNIQPAGMDYAGGHLYVCVDGIINKCTTSPLAVVGAYRIPGKRVFGIAHDAASFLVSTGDEGPAEIHRVLLP